MSLGGMWISGLGTAAENRPRRKRGGAAVGKDGWRGLVRIVNRSESRGLGVVGRDSSRMVSRSRRRKGNGWGVASFLGGEEGRRRRRRKRARLLEEEGKKAQPLLFTEGYAQMVYSETRTAVLAQLFIKDVKTGLDRCLERPGCSFIYAISIVHHTSFNVISARTVSACCLISYLEFSPLQTTTPRSLWPSLLWLQEGPTP